MPLKQEYYLQDDVVHLAKDMLGKVLVTKIKGQLCKARIIETEAYRGSDDRACHAYPYKRTKRTEIMFLEGGYAYIYLCYGIHYLFNIVTGKRDEPNAVLVRAVEPILGLEIIRQRRPKVRRDHELTSGPGKVASAMGIDQSFYGEKLFNSKKIWIEPGERIPSSKIVSTTRVGVDYAGEDAKRPWRFYIKQNSFISRL